MFSPLPAEAGTDSGRLCTEISVVPIILRQQEIGNMKKHLHPPKPAVEQPVDNTLPAGIMNIRFCTIVWHTMQSEERRVNQ